MQPSLISDYSKPTLHYRTIGKYLNWLSPSGAYMRQGIGSTMVQPMPNPLFYTIPLPEQMQTYNQSDR